MPRRLRYLPEPSLVELTARTIPSRHLLLPSPELTEIIGGCLGQGCRRRSPPPPSEPVEGAQSGKAAADVIPHMV